METTPLPQKMKKIGIIRCRQTEDLCGGTQDMKAVAEGKGAFAEFGPGKLVGFVSCGGCPGKRAPARARLLKESGAKVIALASCITKGTPIGFPCPNKAMMLKAIKKELGETFPVLDYTHPAPGEE